MKKPKVNRWLGFMLLVSGTAVVAMITGVAEEPAVPPLHLPDPPPGGLPLAQGFDFHITGKDRDKDGKVRYRGRTCFVWGAGSPVQEDGVVPGCYLSINRDNGRSLNEGLNWWKENHPDWIMYMKDQVSPAWSFTYTKYECVPLDISNPEMREWYFTNLVMPGVRQGYPVISFDNYSLTNVHDNKTWGRSGHYNNGKWVQMYSEDDFDPKYMNDLDDWLAYLTKRLHALGIGVAANIHFPFVNRAHLHVSGYPEYSIDALRRAIETVDIWADEGGFTFHHVGNLADDEWENKVRFMQRVFADKPELRYMSVNQTTAPTAPAGTPEDVEANKYGSKLAAASHEQVAYAIGSFLMVRNAHSMLTLTGSGEYAYLNYRPELDVDIGTPTELGAKLPSGAWQRSYSNGVVLVNPSSKNPATVALPSGIYQDFGTGPELKCNVTLPPNRAMVLVAKEK